MCGAAPSVKALLAALKAPAWVDVLKTSDADAGATTTVLLATNVTGATFDKFEAAAERLHCSMRLEDGSIFVYDLPLARHDVPSMKILELAGRFQWAQAQRRVPPVRNEFTFEGSTLFSVGAAGRRAADQTIRPDGNLSQFPPVIVEVGACETQAELDKDAQFWLTDPRTLGQVHAVITVKVYQRRPHPTAAGAIPGPFAAVAGLYLRGRGGPGVGRTVNPGLGYAGHVGAALAPVIPVSVISFGGVHVAPGLALQASQGLGAPLTGYVSGGGVAPCSAAGLAAYALTVPATHMYAGVPAARLPPGFPDGGNDWTLDLYDVVDALQRAPSFFAGT